MNHSGSSCNDDMASGNGTPANNERGSFPSSLKPYAAELLSGLKEELEALDDARDWESGQWMSLVRQYIEAGGDANDCFLGGECALLHGAARGGLLEVVRFLLAAGADADARDAEGKTPLHLACNAETVAALLKAGADACARDAWGCSPLDVAILLGRKDVAEALHAAGAESRAQEGAGDVPRGG